MFIEVAVITLALVQGSVAGCCIPCQWEGLIAMSGAYHTESSFGTIEGFELYSFDSKSQKVASTQNYTVDGKRTLTTTIQDFNNHKMYMIVNNTCKVSTVGEFDHHCIPDDATRLATGYYGLPDASLPFTTYVYHKNKTTYSTSVTTTGCAPIGLQLIGKLEGADVLLTIGYQNITSGIKNPNVFNVPAICKQRNNRNVELPLIHEMLSRLSKLI